MNKSRNIERKSSDESKQNLYPTEVGPREVLARLVLILLSSRLHSLAGVLK